MDHMYRVLYVDDEPDLLELAKIYLEESQEFVVDIQSSAQKGLDGLKLRHYDAIVADYLMPEMDGIAFLKEVRSAYGDLPFILFTGKGREEIAIQALNSGADFYLRKEGDPQSQFVELAHMIRQAVQWQQTENMLQERNRRYQLIMQSANDAIFIHEIGETTPGRFIEVNDHASRMLGYTRDELLQMSIPDIDIPEMKERAPGIVRELTLTGKVVFQTEMLTKDGRRIPTEVSNRLVELDGRPVVLSLIHDISDLKRTEQALQATNRKLSLLSSITRHDIINQLTLLTGYIRISHGYLDDKKALIKFLEKADKAATTIEHQIRFTREYEEMGVHAPAWQNVHEIIIKAMGGLPLGNIKVEVDRTDLEIFADPLCGRVFYNLIDNALRYGGESMKTIRFSSQESGTGLTIFCEDDGLGIADDVKKRLFTRGFGRNTGLGLFLSREILSITGITITENGSPGKGARFEITVPKAMYRFSGMEKERGK